MHFHGLTYLYYETFSSQLASRMDTLNNPFLEGAQKQIKSH